MKLKYIIGTVAMIGAGTLGVIYGSDLKQGINNAVAYSTEIKRDATKDFVSYINNNNNNNQTSVKTDTVFLPNKEETKVYDITSKLDNEGIRKIIREELRSLPPPRVPGSFPEPRKAIGTVVDSVVGTAYRGVCKPQTQTLAEEVNQVFDKYLGQSGSYAYLQMMSNADKFDSDQLLHVDEKVHGYLGQKLNPENFAKYVHGNAVENLDKLSQSALQDIAKKVMGLLKDESYGPILKTKPSDFWIKQVQETYKVETK